MTTRWTLTCLLVLPLLAACGPRGGGPGKEAEKEDSGERQILVRASAPERGELAARLEITADVEALERADIIPRIEGTVVRVLHEEGDEVKVGDVLAEIECEENELRRDAQSLEVEQAELAIKQAELSLREQKERLAARCEAPLHTIDVVVLHRHLLDPETLGHALRCRYVRGEDDPLGLARTADVPLAVLLRVQAKGERGLAIEAGGV